MFGSRKEAVEDHSLVCSSWLDRIDLGALDAHRETLIWGLMMSGHDVGARIFMSSLRPPSDRNKADKQPMHFPNDGRGLSLMLMEAKSRRWSIGRCTTFEVV